MQMTIPKGGNKMRKRIGIVALAFLFALASAYAQTKDFFELVKTGTPQDVQAAIQNGASVHARMSGVPQEQGKTPLSYAAQYNPDPEVITVLLKAGAGVKEMDTLQETPLMLAAKYNQNPEVIAILLKGGANAKARNIVGWTPLMEAASRNQNPEVINALLKAGADIKAKGEHGWTSLEYAAAGNHNPEVITTLLKAGADAKAKDDNEQTALDYAKNNDALKGTDALNQLEEASK
jgi:ankyrin repeat protein